MFGRRNKEQRAAPRRYHRSADAMGVEQGGRTVLLDLRSEQYFALDDVGTRIWALLDESRTVEAITGELTRTFDVPESVVRQDVEEFLATLERERLLVVE